MKVPSGLVNSTQQSLIAVRWMTTWWLTGGGVGEGVPPAALWDGPGLWFAPVACGWDDGPDATTRYTPYPRTTASTMNMATLQFGERRSFSLIGVDGSKTSAAVITCWVP